MHRITDADLAFTTRFLAAFLQGQPSNGPFSFLQDARPAHVSMDSDGDCIELGDYCIRVTNHPTKRRGLEPTPAPQYEVTTADYVRGGGCDEPPGGDVLDVGTADTLQAALLLVLADCLRVHANAVTDGWAYDALAAELAEGV